MSEKERQRGRDFAKFLSSLPAEQRDAGNRQSHEHSKAEHEKFQAKFADDVCYLCDAPLTSYTKGHPCAHWLLNPKGFTKADFPAVTKRYGFFQLGSFLRWIANTDSFARNINDLKDEGTGKLFESTIRYKELEWSFSCSESDYMGHQTTQHARHAHYHFQMRRHGYTTIKYNDFHIPFKDSEIHQIEAMRAAPELIKHRYPFGEGMGDLLTDETVEHIVNEGLAAEGVNEDDAPFKLDTIVMADEGTTMRGEDIYNIIQEARAKKVTIASLMHKIPNSTARVIVTPGPGVVEQAPRTGGRGKGDNVT